MRILLVDDDIDLRISLARVLARAGHAVTMAPGGREALKAFRQTPNDFDVLVTDWAMPMMTGTQLIEHVRKLNPETILVLMSGAHFEANQIPPYVRYLRKPFANNHLLRAVEPLRLK